MLNVYQELGESSRRSILAELRTGPKNVSDLVKATGLKQPNVSNHLSRLKTKGIVRDSKVGRQVFYALASPEVEAIVQAAFAEETVEDDIPNVEELAKQYAKLAIQGDEIGCSDVLDVAFRARMPLLDVYQEILAPAMTLVGTWYKVEAIDEAQEHMASAITERMMSRTVQISGPIARHGRTAVLGCAANSWHVIGLRMLADYLRLSGWKTLFLGANVPNASFVSAVTQHKPDLVLVSCSAIEGIDDSIGLIRQIDGLRHGRHPLSIGVGGHAVNLYPGKFAAAGADFTAQDLRTFAEKYLPQIEHHGRIVEPDLAFSSLAGG